MKESILDRTPLEGQVGHCRLEMALYEVSNHRRVAVSTGKAVNR